MLETELIPARKIEPRLMIVLHGLGDSMEGYRWLPQAMQLPWMSYLLVNAPDPYYGGFAWYELEGDSGPGIERSRKAALRLAGYHARPRFPGRKKPFSVFPKVALISIELGARYPHLLAGIVGVSGYVHEPERLVREFSPLARQQRF
jgi:phospholipase/carboxylesterase